MYIQNNKHLIIKHELLMQKYHVQTIKIESQRPTNTKASYYAQEKELNPKSPVTLASFMKSSLGRGLSKSTINSSVTSAVAHIYRYVIDNKIEITKDPIVKETMTIVNNLTQIQNK